MVEDIVIDKNKGKKDTAQKPKQNSSKVEFFILNHILNCIIYFKI